MKRLSSVFMFSCAIVCSVFFIPEVLWGQATERQKSERAYANEAWMDGYKNLYAEEVRVCRDGLKSFPDDPDLRELLAEGLSSLGQYDEAETLFRGIIASRKKEDRDILVWALGSYRDLLIKQGRTAEADAIAQRFQNIVAARNETNKEN